MHKMRHSVFIPGLSTRWQIFALPIKKVCTGEKRGLVIRLLHTGSCWKQGTKSNTSDTLTQIQMQQLVIHVLLLRANPSLDFTLYSFGSGIARYSQGISIQCIPLQFFYERVMQFEGSRSSSSL